MRNFVLNNFFNREIAFDVLHTYYICARQEETKTYKYTVKSNSCNYDYLLWYVTIYEQLWVTLYVYIFILHISQCDVPSTAENILNCISPCLWRVHSRLNHHESQFLLLSSLSRRVISTIKKCHWICVSDSCFGLPGKSQDTNRRYLKCETSCPKGEHGLFGVTCLVTA
jgi:hypothetical protein